MVIITKDEYDYLKSTANCLSYYWQVFRSMDTDEKINFEHSFFIRDFITNQRFDELAAVSHSAYLNNVSLTSEQYDYLKECVAITEDLKKIVTDHG